MLQKLPSSQINLYCLSAEISKHQRYRSIYICVDPLYCFLDNNNRSRATLTASRVDGQSSAHTYTTTHRNKTVNVYKIKHIYILYWYFKQSQCLNLRKTYSTQHTQKSMEPLCSWAPVQLSRVPMRYDGTEYTPLLHPSNVNVKDLQTTLDAM